jgi:hypothetical protein
MPSTSHIAALGEKCCNKFKKPTGTSGDPKRDMILRCQWIQQRIHQKSASAVMGVESGGDEGLSLDSKDEDEDSDKDEEEVALVLGGDNAVFGFQPLDNQYCTARLLHEVCSAVKNPGHWST